MYDLVEAGIDGPKNRSFADRLANHQRRLMSLDADVANVERQIQGQQRRITPEIVEQAAILIGSRLRAGDPAFRKAYVHLLIDEVVLAPHEVRLSGRKIALQRLVTFGSDGTDLAPAKVPGFDRSWCRLQDSNL